MPRKTRRILSSPTPARTGMISPLQCVGIALVSFTAGAALTATVMHHAPPASKAVTAVVSPPVSATLGSVDAAPPASLTAGLPPMQASSNLGNWYYDHKQWPQAITNYTQAIQDGLDNPDIRTDLGNAYRFSGKTDQALSEYTKAQAQDTHHENSLFNQGGAYVDEGNFIKAIMVWQKYIQRFPQGQHAAEAKQLIIAARAALKSPHPAGAPHPSTGP